MAKERLELGDCLERMREMEDCSIDAIITDPPYGISFMNKNWDHGVPSEEIWRECLRVLKPGGHLLAFAGTRTQHRMACAIEDAGFEIRDMIAWVYGQGFPKSMDVSKAIDKALGVERKEIGSRKLSGTARIKGQAAFGATAGRSKEAYEDGSIINDELILTAPGSLEAQQWEGWGTALKPALETITLARKPFKGTVAANVLKHGTGALNVDGTRIGDEERKNAPAGNKPGGNSLMMSLNGMPQNVDGTVVKGRWPANFIHDGSDEVDDCLRESSRFFYCAKASRKERGEGNNHPTVKPIALMAYLCRLICPPHGTVLDPFMGSGSTGIAALREGMSFIGIEKEEAYFAIAKQRIEEEKEPNDEEKEPNEKAP